MTELHDALENCLRAIEHGASVEAALKRYPKLAAELRPLLIAASMARDSARIHVPLDVRRRGRSKLQRQVAEMEEQAAPRRRRFIPMFPRLAITGILAGALLLTSTGLVSASSASIPGDQLYPVKRTWESMQLLFVFNPQQRDLMESSFEQERLDEISELIGMRKSEAISFSGILVRQSDGHWVVSGIPVSVSASTNLPAGKVAEGLPISISGVTRSDGVVEAQQIQVLQPGSSLPPLEPSENSDHEGKLPQEEGDGMATAVPSLPSPTPSVSPANPTSSQQGPTFQYSGVVQSMVGNVWRINGQLVRVEGADISGEVTIGSMVRFQGYYSSDGTIAVTTMEPQQPTSTSTKHGGSSGGQSSGGEGEGEGGGSGSGGGEGP